MESLNYSKEKKKEFRIKFVKRNSFQCDKRYFCKQIEKQIKFIIDIVGDCCTDFSKKILVSDIFKLE